MPTAQSSGLVVSKQEIALSTAEADYIVLSQALRDVIPLRTLLKEINKVFPVHVKTPTFVCKVHEDNQSCIMMTTSQKFTLHTKHIPLKYHHFCSHVKCGAIQISYCITTKQKADLLAKLWLTISFSNYATCLADGR